MEITSKKLIYTPIQCRRFKHLLSATLLSLVLIQSASVFAAAESCGSVFGLGNSSSEIQYGGLKFDLVQISDRNIRIRPLVRPMARVSLESPVVKAINKKWDLREFEKPRLPEPVFKLREDNQISNLKLTRVLELPILRPGSEVVLPEEFRPLKSIIENIIDNEKAINSNFGEYHAYLTIDQGVVESGKTQRIPGVHVDGFQGVRQKIKTEPDHSYIVTDAIPTVFYKQPFATDQLTVEHNYFQEMNRQAYRLTEFSLRPNTVYLMDAYSLHRGDLAQETTQRTFIRVTFSKAQYDRLGETDNPSLPKIKRYPRQIPETLKTFVPEDGNFTGYGFMPSVKSKLVREDEGVIWRLRREGFSNHEKTHYFIGTGTVAEATINSRKMGWKLMEEIHLPDLKQTVYRAEHENGAHGFVILNVENPTELQRVQSWLKALKVKEDNIYTWGLFARALQK